MAAAPKGIRTIRRWGNKLDSPKESSSEPYLGDMVILASDLDSTAAHILTSFLASTGIRAVPGDVETERMSPWPTLTAMGRAKIRVPQSQLAQARQLLEAYQRGEFALDDDFDAESSERPDDGENPS